MTTRLRKRGRPKKGDANPDKSHEKLKIKVWVLVGTDLASRAAHFEWTYSQSTKDLINALQRLFARRGVPSAIYSDNGGQLERCSRELITLYEHLDMSKLRNFLYSLPERPTWHFSSPLAAHQGGIWERVVGSMKRSLYAILQHRKLDLETFRTVLLQAECIVNCRPLWAVSSDPDDSCPITPGHLVIGRNLQMIPDNLTEDSIKTPVVTQWRARSRLADEFWAQWKKNYLQALQPLSKWFDQGKEPQVGEIVLLVEEDTPRIQWPLGRIIKVFPNRTDLHVRKVVVTSNGKEFSRDVRSLTRLEAVLTDPVTETACFPGLDPAPAKK